MVVEEMFDVEAVERVGYGETSSLDGNSSIQETKNFFGLVVVPRGSKSSNFALKVERGTIED